MLTDAPLPGILKEEKWGKGSLHPFSGSQCLEKNGEDRIPVDHDSERTKQIKALS